MILLSILKLKEVWVWFNVNLWKGKVYTFGDICFTNYIIIFFIFQDIKKLHLYIQIIFLFNLVLYFVYFLAKL